MDNAPLDSDEILLAIRAILGRRKARLSYGMCGAICREIRIAYDLDRKSGPRWPESVQYSIEFPEIVRPELRGEGSDNAGLA